jgi:sugar/nucleoside kinase (ribokinase family)
MARLDVVGLGASTLDYFTLVDHFPAQEDVQQALDMRIEGGGPVATALATLARLGASAAMIDAIGDDWRGERILAEFQRAGVQTDSITIRPGAQSAAATILVKHATGERTIMYLPASGAALSAADLPQSLIESARYLHVNGRHWEACLQAVRWARAAGVQVSFDGGAQRYTPAMCELVALTDVCIVARDFAERYGDHTDLARLAAALLDAGPTLVAITDGVRGSYVASAAGQAFHQPAYLVPHVVDTTGCGDSYHGAFLFGLLQGLPLNKIAALASAVAALNSQHLGGRGGLPSWAQAQAFLAEREPAA